MLKIFRKVWHPWTTIDDHSGTKFCQATDTADFKLESAKMLLRNSC